MRWSTVGRADRWLSRCYHAATNRSRTTPYRAKVASLEFVEIHSAWSVVSWRGSVLVAPLNQRVRGSIPRRPIHTILDRFGVDVRHAEKRCVAPPHRKRSGVAVPLMPVTG